MKKVSMIVMIILATISMGDTYGNAKEFKAIQRLENLDNNIQSIDNHTRTLVLSMRDDISKIVDNSADKKNIVCLAENIFHEARNQTYTGRVAVAHVTLNRSKINNVNTCKIVYKRNSNGCQFSWVCQNKHRSSSYIEKLAWKESLAIAYVTYNNIINDPTNGANYYYNPKQAHPAWAKKMTVIKTAYAVNGKIGEHVFLKSY